MRSAAAVVPVDASDREYREAVGRICTELAAAAVPGRPGGLRDCKESEIAGRMKQYRQRNMSDAR